LRLLSLKKRKSDIQSCALSEMKMWGCHLKTPLSDFTRSSLQLRPAKMQ